MAHHDPPDTTRGAHAGSEQSPVKVRWGFRGFRGTFAPVVKIIAGRSEFRASLRWGLLGLSMVFTGCVVSFNDWPDAKATGGAQSLGGSASTGGNTDVGGAGGATGGIGGSTSDVSAATGGQVAQRTMWLNFRSDQAKSSDSPNDTLGIDGVVFAYGDGCATGSFDPATRCVRGTTCQVDDSYLNWGMAMEFDFSVDAASVAHTWNPTDHGVVGFAWQLSNTFGTLVQLWAPQMDSKYAGACASDTCSVNLPPYGTGQIGLTGQFYLNAMSKDNWGSGYQSYNFVPANFYCLQFKIPTVIIQRATNFEFCLDKLGVIVQ